MKKNFLRLSVLAISVVMLGAFLGCGPSSDTKEVGGSIVIGGSTALQKLVDSSAKEFMKSNSDVTISVQGGGSGKGISGVQEGSFQIGNSDVESKKKVKNEDMAKTLVDTKVAGQAFGFLTNKNVGIDSLTREQIVSIFTGEITNWKEVGGKDQEIVVIVRPTSSGTRASFKETILNDKNEKEGFQTEESSGAVVGKVKETPGSISYVATNYLKDNKGEVNLLKLDGVEATTENIVNGKYVFWSYGYMVTKGEPSGVNKEFIDFIVSPENKATVEGLGYIPMTDFKK